MTTAQEEVERLLPCSYENCDVEFPYNHSRFCPAHYGPAVLLALQSRDDKLRAAEAEIARLREALEPFAKEVDRYEPDEHDGSWATRFSLGTLRRARAALTPTQYAPQGEKS